MNITGATSQLFLILLNTVVQKESKEGYFLISLSKIAHDFHMILAVLNEKADLGRF
jgi:hypothetical protein